MKYNMPTCAITITYSYNYAVYKLWLGDKVSSYLTYTPTKHVYIL